MEALRNCPFCGGNALTIVSKMDGDFTVHVECGDCHCSTPNVIYYPEGQGDKRRVCAVWLPSMETAREDAVKYWNARAGEGLRRRRVAMETADVIVPPEVI